MKTISIAMRFKTDPPFEFSFDVSVAGHAVPRCSSMTCTHEYNEGQRCMTSIMTPTKRGCGMDNSQMSRQITAPITR